MVWWHQGVWILQSHYNDVIMSAVEPEITGVSIVCSTVCSGAHQRKHLAFVRGIHRWLVDSPHKGSVTRKCFHLMTSLCKDALVPVQHLNIAYPKHWGLVCQKQVSKAGTSNYIPQYMWDVITCPFLDTFFKQVLNYTLLLWLWTKNVSLSLRIASMTLGDLYDHGSHLVMKLLG